MTRTIWLLSLGLTTFLIVMALRGPRLASGQVHLPAGAVETWPPHPSRMVDLSNKDGSGGEVFQQGESKFIFTVPTDQWFVVTSIQMTGSASSGRIDLLMDHGGTLQQKRWNGTGTFDARDGVGYAFPPGSGVHLKNAYGGTNRIWYSIVGYLRRD